MTLVNPNLGTENRKGALAVCAAFVDTLVVAVVVSALSMLAPGSSSASKTISSIC